jgi:hypothetical protein
MFGHAVGMTDAAAFLRIERLAINGRCSAHSLSPARDLMLIQLVAEFRDERRRKELREFAIRLRNACCEEFQGDSSIVASALERVPHL